MKTPYDTARRWRRQELDDVRAALSAAEARLSEANCEISAAEAAIRRERGVAEAHPLVNVEPFIARQRAEIARLTQKLGELEVEIDELRTDLQTRFEALKPLDFASEDYLATKRMEAARREQSTLDEIAARH